MGFRFYRRVRIVPGVTLNLSKGGVSTSIGGRGAHVTFGTKGNRATVGIPGTGMYWTEKLGNQPTEPNVPARRSGGSPNWLGWAIVAIAVVMFLAHYAR
jgi:hypothetical protein